MSIKETRILLCGVFLFDIKQVDIIDNTQITCIKSDIMI